LFFQSSTINLFRYLPPLSGARTCPSGQVRANALILQWSSSWAGKRQFYTFALGLPAASADDEFCVESATSSQGTPWEKA